MQPKVYLVLKPRPFCKALAVLMVFLSWQGTSVFSATWYVAPNGFDTNSGTNTNSPFATIMRAQSAASSSDIVYLRGGTYFMNNTNLTATNNPWAIVNNINKSGISYLAYPDEKPIFNFTNVQPAGFRVTAFLVIANDCVFKGFDVVGVQVTITNNTPGVNNTQSESFRVGNTTTAGNRNRFEQLAMHDGMGIGWYLVRGASNLVLNCDAYNNRGLDSLSMGNADGFGIHPGQTSGTGNVVAGCRAWFNSDDGYDCINSRAAATFSNCWAFYNGYFTNFASSGGDGHGFKSGGYALNGTAPPNPVPRHVTEFCLAVSNRVSGFNANYHPGNLDWFNNTGYRNSVNYNMQCALTNNVTVVPGYDQLMKNNLGFLARSGTEVSNLGATNDTNFNYFSLPVTVTGDDFMSFDVSLLTLPRQTNGDLPYIAFAQLVSSSDLLDAGTNAGFAFAGAAPDLGAFEYAIKPPPTLAMANADPNLIFTGSGGPAGGTNYLVATTNLADPISTWLRVATNKFDLAGNYAITNPIPAGVPEQFYRISLP